MGLAKRNASYEVNRQLWEQMSKKFNVPTRFVELLFSREIDTEEKIELFLRGGVDSFYDPFLLKGMDKAAKRVRAAIDAKEKIVIFSDYDADGICAAAILSLFFKKAGVDAYAHIPDRVSEGYGLNVASLERIIEAVNPDLIITCDCGISCIKEVEYTLDLGVDIVVTDHHSPLEVLPDCVVVNPHQNDCEYPDKSLCGAAVALKLVQALSSVEESLEYCDIAAIATVADLVPLTGESRLITRLGLKTLAERKNLGLSRLMDYLKLDNPTSSDITFKIAPRINAAGRMGDASRSFDLLCALDIAAADSIIKEIDADNEKRKDVCAKIYQSATQLLKNEQLYRKKSIILYDDEWEKGVIGIVASKLVGEYRRPVIIMARAGECFKGTARSIEGINMFEALFKHADLFTEFGGHSQAAGFTINADRVEELKRRLGEYFDEFDPQLLLPRVYYDVEIEEGEVNLAFATALEQMEPCGHGNHLPVFKLSLSQLRYSPCKTNAAHTQIVAPLGLTMYAYNNLAKNQFLAGDGTKDLLIEVQKSQNQGFSPLLVVARQIFTDSLCVDDDYACANFLKTLNYGAKSQNMRKKTYKNEEILSLVEGIYGTLFVAGCKQTYLSALNSPINEHIVLREFVSCATKNNYNRLIVSPDFDAELPVWLYEKIVFLDTPPQQLVNYLAKFEVDVYVPERENYAYLKNVDLSREVFAKYFDIFKRCKIRASSLTDYFKQIREGERVSLTQLVVCLTVFVELGIVAVSKNGFGLQINQSVRSPLDMSKTFNYLKELIDT